MRAAIYEPFGSFRRLQGELNRAFENAAGTDDDTSVSAVAHWSPAVDVAEHTDRFVIRADLPGVAAEDIEITMENSVLTLRGARTVDHEPNETTGGRRLERAFGNFYRRFALPDSADAESIEARSNHGVLEITLPKKAQLKARKIKVLN